MDTNKRMKDDYDQLVQENTKLTNDLRQIEEEVLNVKASLSQSELRNESLMGTNVGLTSEVKRWKDRSDAFLRASDNGQEWIKIQEELKESQEKTKDELKEAQGKNQELTDIINQLRNDFTDLKAKSEQVERDLEAVKNQNINDKAKHQQREEMFKTVVNELKEIVTTCQKELQLTQIDWGNRSGQDRIKNMKEDFERIKNSIIDKIRIDRDDLKTKIKLVEDAQGQVLVMQKKLEESENKIKEKETRIGQLNNVFNSNKTKISALQQEITNLKTQQTNVATATTAATAATIESSHVQKSDFEAIKSKLLQTHIDNEKLKKELFEANCKLTSNQLVVTAAAQPTPSSSGSTSPKQQNSIPTTSSTTNTTSMAASINPGQETQQTPTAYIAPSRINKIQPTQQQTQQQTSANVSSGSSSSLMIRRTAAVQPQPHDSGTNNQRQQYVPPMSVSNPNESSQAQAQTQSFNMTENVLDDAYRNQQQQQEAPSIISMSSNQSTTSFAPKRNREEDP
jgi:chromosome segregation ATPase